MPCEQHFPNAGKTAFQSFCSACMSQKVEDIKTRIWRVIITQYFRFYKSLTRHWRVSRERHVQHRGQIYEHPQSRLAIHSRG